MEKLEKLSLNGNEHLINSKTLGILHKKILGKLLDVGSDTIPVGFHDPFPLNGNYVGLASERESVVSYEALAVETQGEQLSGKCICTFVFSCSFLAAINFCFTSFLHGQCEACVCALHMPSN